MEFPEKNKSTSTGMYGSSNYPPIFDNEPPPMDDFDDDDGFADFQSTNVGATDWNAWPSQSSENHTKDGKEDDSFGDFSAFDSKDNNLESNKLDDENDGVSMKSVLSNGLSGSGNNFGSFNAFGEESNSFHDHTSAKVKENLKDDKNIVNKEDSSIKRTDKDQIETNGNNDLGDIERNSFVNDNSEENSFVSSEREQDGKEVKCDGEFGDFNKINGDFINSNCEAQMKDKMENGRSLSGMPNDMQNFDKNDRNGTVEFRECFVGDKSKSGQEIQITDGSLSVSGEEKNSELRGNTGPDSLILQNHCSSVGFGVSKTGSEVDSIGASCIHSDNGGTEMVLPSSNDSGTQNSVSSAPKGISTDSVEGGETGEDIGVLAGNAEANPSSLSQSLKSSMVRNHNESFGDFSQNASNEFNIGNDFGDFSQFNENATKRKSEVKSDIEENFNNSDVDGVVSVENKHEKTADSDDSKTKENYSGGFLEESSLADGSQQNKTNSSQGKDDRSQKGTEFQSEIDDFQDFSSFDKNKLSSDANYGVKTSTFPTPNIENGNLDGCQLPLKGNDAKSLVQVTSNFNQNTESVDDRNLGSSVHKKDDLQNKLLDSGSMKSNLAKNQADSGSMKSNLAKNQADSGSMKSNLAKNQAELCRNTSNVKENVDTGHFQTQSLNSSSDSFAGFENAPKKTELSSGGESKVVSDDDDDDFGNFEDFSSFSGTNLKAQQSEFESKSNVNSEGGFAGEFNAFGDNNVTDLEDNNLSKETKSGFGTTSSIDSSGSGSARDSPFNENIDTNESLSGRTTGITLPDKVVDDFGDFSEFKDTKGPNLVTAKDIESENADFGNFSEFQGTKEPTFATGHDGKSDSNDFHDFSQSEGTKESNVVKTNEAQSENDGFGDFSEFEGTKEPNFVTTKDSQSENNSFGDFSEVQSTKEPTFMTTKIEKSDSQDFGDFSGLQNTKELAFITTQDPQSKSGDFGDFSEFQSTEEPSLVTGQNNQSNNDDFGDFSDFQNTKESDFVTNQTTQENISGKRNDNTSPKSTGNVSEHTSNDDDFATFQDFSKAPGDASFFPAKTVSQNENWGDFSSNQNNSTAKATTQSNDGFDNFASFSQGDSTSSTVPRLQKEDDDDNWASFDSGRKRDLSGSKIAADVSKANDFGGFNQRPSFPDSANSQNKGISAKLSAKLHPLLSPCFPKTNKLPSGKLPTQSDYSLLTAFLGQEKSNGLPCVWSKLIGSDEVEQSWNLSFQSSTNFKWTLATIGVSYEHIIKKWKHSSHDTQSSLSPTSSVASFDVDSSVEPMAILVPEPAGRANSLLKPTLLAQSQQKELDLHRVPSVSSLKKGDSGSETTSETASLDLEFFSSGVASVTSSQSNKDLASLNEVNFFNIASDSISVTSADIPTSKRGTDSQPVASQAEKASASLPFNLDALNKASVKNNLSKEAKGVLEQLDDLKFMNSSVLMFPSQFSSE